MIRKIIFDGNDGTGKTTRLNYLKQMFPNIEYADRGIFSKMTLVDELFYQNENTEKLREDFYNNIKNNSDVLYIICKASPEVCQRRIIERGDSIEEEFHTMKDLIKYNERFDVLVNIVKELSNVMLVDSSSDFKMIC